MKVYALLIVLGILFAAVGCTSMSTNHIEQDRNDLLARDQQWAQNPTVDHFVSFFAADGSFLPAHMPAADGIDAIRRTATQLFSYPGFNVRWQPTKVDVANSGDLGYTRGTYQLSFQGPGNVPMSETGKYVTVWRKRDQQWWVMQDIYNPDTPPSGTPPTTPSAPPAR